MGLNVLIQTLHFLHFRYLIFSNEDFFAAVICGNIICFFIYCNLLVCCVRVRFLYIKKAVRFLGQLFWVLFFYEAYVGQRDVGAVGLAL